MHYSLTLARAVRSKSAFNGYFGLDESQATWDTKEMNQRVRLLLVLLSIGIGAGLACRERGAETGVGGQSGDEGRRATGLGNGGAGSTTIDPELRPRR